ncbi:hypothetical protein ACVW1A_002112 [Bradyrhizobium sp. LB1.3]
MTIAVGRGLALRYVRSDGDGAAAALADLIRQLLGLPDPLAAVDRHGRAGLGQRTADRSADSARAPGDERGASLQNLRHDRASLSAVAYGADSTMAGRAPALNSSRDKFVCLRSHREKCRCAPVANMDTHFIDRTRQSLDIRSIETAP